MAEAAFSKENGSTVYLLVEHLAGENPTRDIERRQADHAEENEHGWHEII